MKKSAKEYVEEFPLTAEISMDKTIANAIEIHKSGEQQFDYSEVVSASSTAYSIGVAMFALCREFDLPDKEVLTTFQGVFAEAKESHYKYSEKHAKESLSEIKELADAGGMESEDIDSLFKNLKSK